MARKNEQLKGERIRNPSGRLKGAVGTSCAEGPRTHKVSPVRVAPSCTQQAHTWLGPKKSWKTFIWNKNIYVYIYICIYIHIYIYIYTGSLRSPSKENNKNLPTTNLDTLGTVCDNGSDHWCANARATRERGPRRDQELRRTIMPKHDTNGKCGGQRWKT